MQQTNLKIVNCRNSAVTTVKWWALGKIEVMGCVNDSVALDSIRCNWYVALDSIRCN
jgi:hypothetical protein